MTLYYLIPIFQLNEAFFLRLTSLSITGFSSYLVNFTVVSTLYTTLTVDFSVLDPLSTLRPLLKDHLEKPSLTTLGGTISLFSS